VPNLTPTPNVAWFGIHATLKGVDVEMGAYFRRLVPPITFTNLDAESTQIMFAWRFGMVPQLCTDITWRNVTAIDLTPGSTLSVVTPFFPGTGSQGAAAPNHIAFSLMPSGITIPRPWQWRTRIYGVPQSKVIGDMLNPTWASAMRTLVRDRYTLQGAFGWRISVVQQTVSGVPLAVGIPHDVTDYTIPSLVVSPMRRRLT